MKMNLIEYLIKSNWILYMNHRTEHSFSIAKKANTFITPFLGQLMLIIWLVKTGGRTTEFLKYML